MHEKPENIRNYKALCNSLNKKRLSKLCENRKAVVQEIQINFCQVLQERNGRLVKHFVGVLLLRSVIKIMLSREYHMLLFILCNILICINETITMRTII